MPNIDLLKVALVLILVAALGGLAVWFMAEVAPGIVSSGESATSALNVGPASAWGAVVSIFGPAWGVAWDVALVAVLLFGSVFLLFRVIRWVTG